MRCPEILHDIAEKQQEPGETKGDALARYIETLREGKDIDEFKARFRSLSSEEQLRFMQFCFTNGNPLQEKKQQVTA
jgi:hypothetical protein